MNLFGNSYQKKVVKTLLREAWMTEANAHYDAALAKGLNKLIETKKELIANVERQANRNAQSKSEQRRQAETIKAVKERTETEIRNIQNMQVDLIKKAEKGIETAGAIRAKAGFIKELKNK